MPEQHETFNTRPSDHGDASSLWSSDSLWSKLPNKVAELDAASTQTSSAPGTEAQLNSSANLFERRHHVDIAQDGGTFVYTIAAGGKTTELFRTTADLNGLNKADSKLSKLVSEREQQIQEHYGVMFSQTNERIEPVRAAVNASPTDKFVLGREPELFELIGVDAALSHSAPDLRENGENPVKIYFLDKQPITDVNATATFQYDQNDNASLYIWPPTFTSLPATEKDLTPEQQALPFSDRNRPETIEGAVTHEFGHRQYSKLGYLAERPHLGAVEHDTEAGKELIGRMGWTANLNRDIDDSDWYMLGKSFSSDGKRASYRADVIAGITFFKRWRADGGEENSAGQKVPAGLGETFNESEMLKHALVPPATWYYMDPQEMYAESVKMFRLNGASRKELLTVSPTLYGIIKSDDQRNIDSDSGVTASGAPRTVRDIDGDLVANTEQERARVQEFEQTK